MKQQDHSFFDNDSVTTETIIPEEELHEAESRNEESVYTVQIDNPIYIKGGLSSVIGSRSVQQDAARIDNEYMYQDNGVYLAVMCDGMGGLNGGEIASRLCVTKMFEAFYCVDVKGRVPEFFKFMIENLDKMVYNLTDDNNRPIHAGSTLTSIIIDGNLLYWAGVGDSRIYVKRGKEMVCVTQDHNYGYLLDKKVKEGKISREEAMSDPQREALISYMGIGGVTYMNINPHPFVLRNGDTVLLCSDGLYRALSESEISRLIETHHEDMQKLAEALTSAAIAKGKRHQDNTTAALVQYCENVNISAPFNMPIK